MSHIRYAFSHPITVGNGQEEQRKFGQRNKVYGSAIYGLWSEPILPLKQNWEWYFKDSIHLKTIIK